MKRSKVAYSKIIYIIYSIVVLIGLSLYFKSGSCLIAGFMGIVIICIISRRMTVENSNKIFKSLLVITSISFIFMLLNYYGLISMYGKPYYASDDEKFEYYALRLLENRVYFFKDLPYIYGLDFARGYLIPIIWLMKLSKPFGGYSTLSPRILNIFLWLSVSLLVYKMMIKNQVSENNAKKIWIILSLFPNALYISSFVYRDTLVCFLFFVSYYLIHELVTQKINFSNKIIRLIIIGYSIYVLYYTRLQMLYVLLVLVIIELLFNTRFAKKNVNKVFIILAGGILGLVILSFTGGLALFGNTVSSYAEYNLTISDGLSRMIFGSSLFPFGWILRAVYGLMVPFPAELLALNYISRPVYSLVRVLVLLGTVFQLFLLPYLFKKENGNENRIRMYALGIVYLSIILTTFTFRHFIMVYPFFALAIANKYDVMSVREKKRNFLIISILLFLGVLLYLFLKVI